MVKQRNRQPFQLIGILVSMLLLAVLLSRPNVFSELKTSEVIDMFRNNQVKEYTLDLGDGKVEIITRKGEEG